MRSLIALLCAAALYAQVPDRQWDNLKSLHPGQRVQVVETSMKSWSGRFVSADAGAITIRLDSEKTIPRPSVYRVSVAGHARNAVIGLGIGAGAGIGLGAAIMAREEEGYGSAISEGAAYGVMTAVGAAAGLAIGYCFPTHKTLYRAEFVRTVTVRERRQIPGCLTPANNNVVMSRDRKGARETSNLHHRR